LELGKNLTFHREIGFEITMRGGNLLVAEPRRSYSQARSASLCGAASLAHE
jgi:hypothetical protein